MSLLDPEPWATERLTLRPLRIDDSAVVSAHASDPEVTRYLSFATHTSPAEANDYLRMAVDRNATPGMDRAFLIERRADGVGLGSFTVRPRGERAEVGYLIARPFWNQGYATEALREAIALLLAERDIRRVEAYHDIENPASGRVMRKAGMTRQGVLRSYMLHPNVSSEPRDAVLYAAVR